MEKKRIITLAITIMILLGFLMPAGSVVFAEVAEDNVMAELHPVTNRSYGAFRIEWEEAEGADGYNAILQSVDEEGNAEDLVTGYCWYPNVSVRDYVLYSCQENGVPYRMRFRIEALSDGEKTAEGYSEEFDPREIWPEKERLDFGTDIPLDSIRYVSWDSSGMTVESNWSYTASCYGGETLFSFSRPGKGEAERKLSSRQWDRLCSLISQGHMERDYYEDPTLEILDGGDERIRIAWDSGDKEISHLYRFVSERSVEDEIKNWFNSREKLSILGWKKWTLIISCILIILMVFIGMIYRLK